MGPKSTEAARGLADRRTVAIQRRKRRFLRSLIRWAENLSKERHDG